MNEDLQRALIISAISTVAVFYIGRWLDEQDVLPGSSEPEILEQ